MKKIITRPGRFLIISICLLLIAVVMNGCSQNDDVMPSRNFAMVTSVASQSSYGANRVDANLVNGWGIAFAPSGTAWISSEDAGVSVVYDKNGAQVLGPVSIPSPTAGTGGAPTGQVYNGT